MTNKKNLIFFSGFYILSILLTFVITYKFHDNIVNLKDQ